MTLLALLQARDEERFLPGWLANLASVVDGIVALDDGSRDQTYEILRSHPKTVELLRNQPGKPWDERANQIALVKAGRLHGATWFLCLDADERLEQGAEPRLRHLMEEPFVDVLSFRLCELWGDRSHFRVDGAWGKKARHRMFRNIPSHRLFDPRPIHRVWMPIELASRLSSNSRDSSLNIYHLRTITSASRAARVARYEALDPEHRYQPTGYDYLVDEQGLELEQIPPDRDFVPFDDPASAVG